MSQSPPVGKVRDAHALQRKSQVKMWKCGEGCAGGMTQGLKISVAEV